MFLKILSLPVAMIKDIATLGGAINDGYWSNGNRTYTGRIFKDISDEVKFNDDLRQIKKTIKAVTDIAKIINQ